MSAECLVLCDCLKHYKILDFLLTAVRFQRKPVKINVALYLDILLVGNGLLESQEKMRKVLTPIMYQLIYFFTPRLIFINTIRIVHRIIIFHNILMSA